jgi:hypothetical protein
LSGDLYVVCSVHWETNAGKRYLTKEQWLAVPSGCKTNNQLANDLFSEKMAAAKIASGGKHANSARLWEAAKLEADIKAPQRREKKTKRAKQQRAKSTCI